MIDDQIFRNLWSMRAAQVKERRTAIYDKDMSALRQAQSDIDIIDRAIYDEDKLAKEWMRVEENRLADVERQRRQRPDDGWVSNDEQRNRDVLL